MMLRSGFRGALIFALALAGCTAASSTSSTQRARDAGPQGPAGLIVLRCGVQSSQSSICTTRPDGTGLTQLTPTPAGDDDTHPWLSPDGSQIVFVRYLNDNHLTSDTTAPEHDVLMVANTDGTGLHELTPSCTGACARQCAPASLPCPGDDYPSWSPDGTHIAFERAYGSDVQHLTVSIWVADADGSHAVQLTHPQPASEDHSPSWSPDGRRIVFDRFDGSAPNGGRARIETIGADGKGLRLVYLVPSRWPFGGAKPRWSPDGSRILFSDFCWMGSQDGCPADTPATGAHLFTIAPDGTGLTQLTRGSMNELFPAWSPDGRWIVFSRTSGFGDSDGFPEMYLMHSDGTGVRPIVSAGCPCLAEWGVTPAG